MTQNAMSSLKEADVVFSA